MKKLIALAVCSTALVGCEVKVKQEPDQATVEEILENQEAIKETLQKINMNQVIIYNFLTNKMSASVTNAAPSGQ